MTLLNGMRPHVLVLATNEYGCLVLQQAIEAIVSPVGTPATPVRPPLVTYDPITNAPSPNNIIMAAHLASLTKCDTMKPAAGIALEDIACESLKSMVDAMVEKVVSLAKDQHGCNIIECLMRRSSNDPYTVGVIDKLLPVSDCYALLVSTGHSLLARQLGMAGNVWLQTQKLGRCSILF